MAKKPKAPIKHEVHEEIQVIDAGAQYEQTPVVEVPSEQERMVKIILPVQLKINRVPYGPGPVVVPARMVDSIVEMVDKKKRADISIFTGSNFLVQRMMDRTLVVTKVEKL